MNNRLKLIAGSVLLATVLASPLTVSAAEQQKEPHKKPEKPKPYVLKTCLVSDEKLGGDMGEPYVFAYQGREVKLCCKECKKDFDKTPAKFIQKLTTAEKKMKEKTRPTPPAHSNPPAK